MFDLNNGFPVWQTCLNRVHTFLSQTAPITFNILIYFDDCTNLQALPELRSDQIKSNDTWAEHHLERLSPHPEAR